MSSSQQSPCAFFFFFHASTTSAVCYNFCRWLFFNCVHAPWIVRSNAHLFLFTYTPECHCMSCIASAVPLRLCRPPVHSDLMLPFAFSDYLFNVCCHNRLQSFVTHDLWPFPLSALYMPRELGPSDPDCLFIFSPSVSDHMYTLRGGPPLSTLPVCS